MNIEQTYIFYYFLILITTCIVYFSEDVRKSKYKILSKYVFYFAMLFPIIISAFRYGIGTDYFSYENGYYRYTQYDNFWTSLAKNSAEEGWILLNYLVEIIFSDVIFVFIISSILIIVFNFIAIYSYGTRISIVTAVLIFMCTLYFPSFNMIRFSLAAGLLLISFKYIEEKKLWKFIVLVLIASGFHYTALIFIPLYWFVNYRNPSFGVFKKALLYCAFIFLVTGFDFFYSFLIGFESFSKYENYDLSSNNQYGIGNIILRLPVILIVIFNLKKLKYKDSFIYDITILYFITFLLQFLGYKAGYIGRISIYFEMTQVLILGSIVKIQDSKTIKVLVQLLIFVYFILWFTYEIIVLNNHETIPYILK